MRKKASIMEEGKTLREKYEAYKTDLFLSLLEEEMKKAGHAFAHPFDLDKLPEDVDVKDIMREAQEKAEKDFISEELEGMSEFLRRKRGALKKLGASRAIQELEKMHDILELLPSPEKRVKEQTGTSSAFFEDIPENVDLTPLLKGVFGKRNGKFRTVFRDGGVYHMTEGMLYESGITIEFGVCRSPTKESPNRFEIRVDVSGAGDEYAGRILKIDIEPYLNNQIGTCAAQAKSLYRWAKKSAERLGKDPREILEEYFEYVADAEPDESSVFYKQAEHMKMQLDMNRVARPDSMSATYGRPKYIEVVPIIMGFVGYEVSAGR